MEPEIGLFLCAIIAGVLMMCNVAFNNYFYSECLYDTKYFKGIVLLKEVKSTFGPVRDFYTITVNDGHSEVEIFIHNKYYSKVNENDVIVFRTIHRETPYQYHKKNFEIEHYFDFSATQAENVA